LAELARRDMEIGIQIQILRIAEGGEHTAQICRDVLQHEQICHIFFLLRYRQSEIAQRQKGNQCHVVGNDHRADEGDGYEQKEQ